MSKLFRRLISLVVLVAFSQFGSSQTNEDEVDRQIARGGFYLPGQLPLAPAQLDRALKATVRIDQGSGVILSSDGYVALNIHGFMDCLQPGYEYTPQIRLSSLHKEGFYDITRILEQVPRRLKCPDYIETKLAIFEYAVSEPRVVWIGKGRSTHSSENITKLSEPEFSAVRDNNEDVVILKYDLLPGTPPLPCAHLAAQAKPGDPVWAIGYPMSATRDSGFNSNGYSQYVSLGKMRSSLREDTYLQGVAAQLPASEQDLFWQRETAIWNSTHLLLTSTDAIFGNSGGMMIDSKGELLAILSTVTRASTEAYTGGTVMGVRADYIRAQVTKFLGAHMAETIFSCPAAVPNS